MKYGNVIEWIVPDVQDYIAVWKFIEQVSKYRKKGDNVLQTINIEAEMVWKSSSV